MPRFDYYVCGELLSALAVQDYTAPVRRCGAQLRYARMFGLITPLAAELPQLTADGRRVLEAGPC